MAEVDYKTELRAIQQVLDILSRFDDAARDKIIRTVSTFFAGDSLRIGGQSGVVLPSATERFFEQRSTSAKDFIASKRPTGLVERIACLAYYLTRFRELNEFSVTDITRVNAEAGLPRLTNASHAVRLAEKQNILTASGDNKKRLTVLGENRVNMLPEQRQGRELAAAGSKNRRARKTARKSPGKKGR